MHQSDVPAQDLFQRQALVAKWLLALLLALFTLLAVVTVGEMASDRSAPAVQATHSIEVRGYQR